MRKKLFVSLLLSLTAMAFAVSAFAQVTTAALGGRVTDASGESVPGAAVIAVHQPSGSQYYGLTNAEGRYSINGMRSGGPYTVEISCMGYRKVNYTDVTLLLAEVYSLDARLDDDKLLLSEAVVISEASSKFAADKTGAAMNISNKEIISIPTISRSITDVTRLSPYGGNGMSFAGTDGRTANFTVDGANFNNNFGLSSNLPGGGNPISIDALEELQVVISPYDVRQANFKGGGVNAITKSGTNTLKGTAYVYHRNENMRGNTVNGIEQSGARETDRNTTYGMTLGGPIIKNKLFFFVNFEYSKTPSVAVRWRGSADGKGNEAKSISYCTLDDLEAVKQHMWDTYKYDTGSYTDFPADQNNMKALARIDWNISDKHHLALRYNYTNNLVWNGPNASSMDGGTRSPYSRTSLYSMSFANSMYSMNNTVHTGSIDLNSRLSDNLSNQFLATFSKLDDVRGSNSADFPFIDIQDGTGNNVQYMSLGYELFTWNNAVHNTVANVKDDITYYAGNHKITAGVSYEYQMADNQYMRNGTGYYRYGSVDDFIKGRTPEIVALTYGYVKDGTTEPEFAPAARVQFHKPGVYLQDEWAPGERFKLTAGVRVDGLFFDNQDLMTNKAIQDLTYYPEVYGYEEKHIDTGVWPTANFTISPRIGFTWDVLGNKRLKIRGGTGLFSGRIPLVFFTNMPTNGGLVQYKAAISGKTQVWDGSKNKPKAGYENYTGKYTEDSKGNRYVDMSQFAGNVLTRTELYNKLIGMGFPATATPESGTVPSSISAVDPNFKMPQEWKTSLAVDYSFPTSFPFSVSVEGMFNKTVNDVTITDWSMKPVESFATFNGADNRPIYPSNFRSTTKAFVLGNTNLGYGWSGNVSLKMQPIPELDIYAAYTHVARYEVTGLPGSDAESAFTYVPTSHGPNYIRLHSSQYVTPDRVIASLTHNDHSGNHFSLIYESWRGGYNYSYMVSNDMNGDGYQYDALYIPTDKQIADNEFRFVDTTEGDKIITAADSQKRFMEFVHNDPYLSKHQGEYAEPYAVYSPWVHRFDFAYKHDFKVNIGKTVNILQLSCDLKNIANLFNSSWGVSQTMNSKLNSGRILKYEGADAEGYATFSTPSAVSGNTATWTPVYSIGQCWYASVGIKYMFN
ncbi:MAG: TonB-dependent receptor [Bacteroidales bacterium]|nr:TonB-dependent receptor [Bacteroidales bacterium]